MLQSDLFERRRQLVDDWAEYLDGHLDESMQPPYGCGVILRRSSPIRSAGKAWSACTATLFSFLRCRMICNYWPYGLNICYTYSDIWEPFTRWRTKTMPNQFNDLPNSQTWSILAGAATRALEGAGLGPERVPGRGRSNVWKIEENGRHKRVSVRTTKNRWFAFPPLQRGTKWKTLDDVDIVVVAAVDDPDAPRNVEVYRFDAEEVRRRFDASYAARIKAGQTVRDDFGMWVSLDEDDRGLPASVGAGLATAYPPITTFALDEPIAENAPEPAAVPDGGETVGTSAQREPRTIAAVMDSARKRIATLSGVRIEAVKLDCRIET